jgi:MFS family permease
MAISTVTATLAVAIPFSCMPSLFKEISDDLGLSLVQIGTIWGIGSLAAFFINLVGGFLGDRFGAKVILVILCVLGGITGAARGLSQEFFLLAATVFVNSLVRAIIPIIITKMIGIWFRGYNLGMANGVTAMGMGLGLMLGPMVSATFLSPALGGWRNVLYLYGAISLGVAGLWAAFGREPPHSMSTLKPGVAAPMMQTLKVLIRNKSLWFSGLAVLFRTACMSGMMGYLPLYLRGQGWAPGDADGALAAFFGASTLFVIPLSILSDRIGSRKIILFPSLVLSVTCVGLLPLAHGAIVWLLVVLAGMSFDGFMATMATYILETQGVGQANTGTALGLVFTISQPGGIVGPPLGNAFASISPGAPFIFWALIAIPAAVFLGLSKETGWKTSHSRSKPGIQSDAAA